MRRRATLPENPFALTLRLAPHGTIGFVAAGCVGLDAGKLFEGEFF